MDQFHCQHPGCHDLASRKSPEIVERAGRRICLFRNFCAAHTPAALRITATVTGTTLPAHQNTAGQVHIPRVWEITGKAPEDRRRAVREWNDAYQRREAALAR